ncbi:MAG TPA: hypothetical protein VF332_02555 [Vicinamibacterales bacterium]
MLSPDLRRAEAGVRPRYNGPLGLIDRSVKVIEYLDEEEREPVG